MAKKAAEKVFEGKSVVIVESPAKTKTIKKILGNSFEIIATMGHIRDLPSKSLGIDVENNFELEYSLIATRKKVIDALKKAVKNAPMVFLAPDPDREGEAIAWHVAEALKLEQERMCRITFNEITPTAIREAIEHPSQIHMLRVESQQARRILDRIVGYKISPLLWKKIARGLSAGRVQSVALWMIVKRENEITAFKPEEFWKFKATNSSSGYKKDAFDSEILKLDGKAAKVTNEKDALELKEHLNGSSWIIKDIVSKVSNSKPFPPFNTALLQQAGANKLGFSAKKTMMLAQQLYEGIELGSEGSVGLITYMRTDSYRLSSSSIEQVRGFIETEYGKEYLPAKPKVIQTKAGAQDAHEAIRPTDVLKTPDSIKSYLSRDQLRLYKLIWHQFVASQMKPAKYEIVNVDIAAGRTIFRANGRRLLFDGYLKGSFSPEKVKDQILPELTIGQELKLLNLDVTQHFTQPPARYTEATLVKAMEKEGIGRPSTYAAIISTILDRGYVSLLEKKFHPTELGTVVVTKLVKHFPDIINISFTREMEGFLDDIEEDKRNWLEVIKEFYEKFARELELASKEMESFKNKPLESGELCPDCGKPIVSRMSKLGSFMACSGYPKCKYVLRNEESEKVFKTIDEKCPDCDGDLVEKSGRRGKFIACSNYPQCKYTRSLKPSPGGELSGYLVEDVKCPKCESPMKLRFSKRGPFLGCSKFPKCRGISKLPEGLLDRIKERVAFEKAEKEAAGTQEPQAETKE